jgi:hypothetical protein
MTIDCLVCDFKARDATDYSRHLVSLKHLTNCPSEEVVLDFRQWTSDETNKYIKEHEWFIKADPIMAGFRQKEKRFKEILDILQTSKSTLTPKQKEDYKKAIQSEYSDNEDETEEVQNERIRRIEALDYSISKDELEKLIIEKDELLQYICDHQKDGCADRHIKLREKIKDKMLSHLAAIDKKRCLDAEKENDTLEKLELQKQELDLKIQLLTLNMKKKQKK